MAKIDSMRTLLVQELRDLYDAEKRLIKAIPKLVKETTSDDLSTALEEHLRETEEQVSR
jgi:ferritin-like metal-binding protein YciE